MKKRILPMVLAGILLLQGAAFAAAGQAGGIVIEGRTKIVKPNEGMNFNPYNIASISGVGEGNQLTLFTPEKIIQIPLSAPLYKISEVYCDKIIYQDGVWGVLRQVGVYTFDGSEGWTAYKKPSYNNARTTLFTCDNPVDTTLADGFCTHFDLLSDKAQRENVYDGISYSPDFSKMNLRFMTGKNIPTAEALTAYLQGQKDAGHPVKLFYIRQEAVFEAFPEEVQQELHKVGFQKDVLGFADPFMEQITYLSEPEISKDLFTAETTGNPVMDRFLSAVTDVKLYHADPAADYFIAGLIPMEYGFTVTASSSAGEQFAGMIIYSEHNFSSPKPAELTLKNETGGMIKLQLLLPAVEIPKEAITGFTLEQTGIQKSASVSKELVLPAFLPVVDGKEWAFYYDNMVLYGDVKESISLAEGETGDHIDARESYLTITPKEGDRTYETEIISVPPKTGTGVTRIVLSLGDSLIAQNYYTEALYKLFESDPMNIVLTGTLGPEGNKHEGRGGWSAYDYCNTESKYGFTNPFLHNGEFDFAYYCEQNKLDAVDTVILNLGINDLNLIGHNSHGEILGYFDEIIKSIHTYNKDIRIILNAPTLLYASEKTTTAKDIRLAFIKTMMEAYEGREGENIYLSPVYISIHPRLGYKFEEPVINEDNQDRSMVVTDTTHPTVDGYKSMAEATYHFLKYLEIKGQKTGK